MANQMIALQARNPQLPDPARVTAQMANMISMASQQRAAQRQAEQAEQAMRFAAAKEGRDIDLDAVALKKAEQEYVGLAAEQFREAVSKLAEGDIAGAEAARADIVAKIPAYAQYIRPASEWTREYRYQLMLKAKDIVDKTIATPVASLELSQSGMPRSVTVGGLNPEQRPVYDAPETSVAPRAPAAAPSAAPQSTAAAEPGSLGLVVASALETGVMSKSDYDKIISIAPPESRAKIAAWVQQNNIQVTPNTPSVTDNQMRGAPADFEVSPMSYDGRTPESQFAVYRGEPMQSQTAGLRGAPPMEQTLAQTRTSTPLQMRNPNVAPYPGSAQVPIERVRQEAVAGRESPAEAAAKAAATARASATVETEKKAAEKLPGRKQVSTIIRKIRGAYEQLEKRKAIASEKRGGFANVMDYLATTGPGREVQKALGTSASKYLSEIVNSRKLLATAIKNATGMSAQEMNSNVELQLTLDALTDPTQGIEAARSTLDTLEELYGVPAPKTATAAPRAAAKTPVIPDAAKQMLRKNPSPQQRAFFDRTFGKGAAAKVLGVR